MNADTLDPHWQRAKDEMDKRDRIEVVELLHLPPLDTPADQLEADLMAARVAYARAKLRAVARFEASVKAISNQHCEELKG